MAEKKGITAHSLELKNSDLRRTYDISELPKRRTTKAPPVHDIVSQDRAVQALKFGLQMKGRGFNIYLSGDKGTGKRTISLGIAKEIALTRPSANDVCYVYNFKNADTPKAISLPSGLGIAFKKDTDEFVGDCREEIPKVFEGKEYEESKNDIMRRFEEKKEELLQALEKKVEEAGFQLKKTMKGLVTVPVVEGKILKKGDIEELSPEQRGELEKTQERVNEYIRDTFRHIVQEEKKGREEIEKLNREFTLFAVGHLLADLRDRYSHYPRVLEYLEELQDDIADNIEDFLAEERKQIAAPPIPMIAPHPFSFTRYSVNLVVDNSLTKGAPVIYESHPTFLNLIGRIEREARFGTLHTDFTMIKPGALIQANGGVLVLDALALLMSPFAWDTLKRTLKTGELKIEDMWEQYGYISTMGLKPEPIPLNLKVVMIGDPWLYELLCVYDEDFKRIFKVKADFDSEMTSDKGMLQQYALFIDKVCQEEDLLPFSPEAVAALAEYSAREVGHKNKLSIDLGKISDLVREANYWASLSNLSKVDGAALKRALEEKRFRSNLTEEKIHELIRENTIFVDVKGAVVGQINGLAVYQIGDYTFGKPSRITAQTFMGRDGVLNIEREAKMSGNIHDKGVLILTGYLGGKYAHNKLLTLSASICFEQSYGLIEGDSASLAELLVLLSSLSKVPLKQGIAITGSVNQLGAVQPIGGVNEKIEGFYYTCEAMELTGDQGVIIPKANVKHLMLRDDIVSAVAKGKFHIWAVSTVDEALELITGRKAGERLKDGTYEKGTVNFIADRGLIEIAAAVRAFGEEAAAHKKKKGAGETKAPKPTPRPRRKKGRSAPRR